MLLSLLPFATSFLTLKFDELKGKKYQCNIPFEANKQFIFT